MSLFRLASSPYSEKEWNAAIDQLKCYLLQCMQPSRIFLFGSSITGPRTAESDIDLAIVLETPAEKLEAQKKILAGKFEIEIPVDYLFFHRLEFEESAKKGGVADAILRTGKAIYANPGDTKATPS